MNRWRSTHPSRQSCKKVHGNSTVLRGALLVALDQPDIGAQLEGTRARLHALDRQLSAQLAEAGGLGAAAATRQRAEVQLGEVSAARAETTRLQIAAPFSGIWSDTDPQLAVGNGAAAVICSAYSMTQRAGGSMPTSAIPRCPGCALAMRPDSIHVAARAALKAR